MIPFCFPKRSSALSCGVSSARSFLRSGTDVPPILSSTSVESPIGIVRDALETIAVVDSHRPPAQVEAEMTQFLEVALDFVPPKRREDFYTAFQKALKAAT